MFLNAGDYVVYSLFINPIPPSRYLITPLSRPGEADLADLVHHSSIIGSGLESLRGLRGGALGLGGGGSGGGMPSLARGGLMGDSQPPYIPGYPYPLPTHHRHDYPGIDALGAPDQPPKDEGRWPLSSSTTGGSGSSSGGHTSNKRQRGLREEEDNGDRERHVAAALQRLYQQPTHVPSPSYPLHSAHHPYGGSPNSGPSALAAALESSRGSLHPYLGEGYGGDSRGHLAMVAAAAAQQEQASSGVSGGEKDKKGHASGKKPTMRI